ncbi:hypothetical protein MJ585_11600 [Klebsiella pneumoniae]|nr:hypothetical protein MJ585_11600 [Klebsiella pneumoniae]
MEAARQLIPAPLAGSGPPSTTGSDFRCQGADRPAEDKIAITASSCSEKTPMALVAAMRPKAERYLTTAERKSVVLMIEVPLPDS